MWVSIAPDMSLVLLIKKYISFLFLILSLCMYYLLSSLYVENFIMKTKIHSVTTLKHLGLIKKIFMDRKCSTHATYTKGCRVLAGNPEKENV